MSNSSNNNGGAAGGGIGFCGLLTILFIGLKLGGVIHWSWLWVLSPLWIPFVAAIGIVALVVLVILFIAGFGLFLEKVSR
jgi:hypothetical protein